MRQATRAESVITPSGQLNKRGDVVMTRESSGAPLVAIMLRYFHKLSLCLRHIYLELEQVVACELSSLEALVTFQWHIHEVVLTGVRADALSLLVARDCEPL